MKVRLGIGLVAIMVACCAWVAGRSGVVAEASSHETPLRLDRLDPGIDRIVPAGARLERVATGFNWAEGPVWVKGGVLFSDIFNQSICRWEPGHGASIFLQDRDHQEPAWRGRPQADWDGLTLDARGRLTVAGNARRDVYRFETLSPSGPITILADRYQGKRLNSPNDLVYRSDGSLYFTDPPFGLPTTNDQDPGKQLKVNGIYRIPHALEQKPGSAPARGELQLLVSDLPRPNGIAFSPDEKYLYVDNTAPREQWIRYTVKPDGGLTDAKLLYDDTADKRPGSPDGMKVDMAGNLYSAGPGGVWIFSPQGKPLGTLLIPERVSNVAWGGADRKTLYITTAKSLYRVRLKIAGEPVVRH